MTESTHRIYDEYFCKNGGPTDIDISYLTDLRTPDLLSTEQIEQTVKDLRAFGTNQQEITRNLLMHIANCGDCTKIYQQQMVTSLIVRELYDVLIDVNGVPAWKRQ